MFKARGKRIKIKLEKILNNQGLFAPSALNGGVEFNFKTPDASDIMIAQSGESVGGYALKEPKLIYESIESPENVLPSRNGLHEDRILFHGRQLSETYQLVERPNVRSRNH